MRVSSSAKITVEDQLSVYSLLAGAAARAPQATAITFLPSMESEPVRLTHGALLSRLHRVARAFRGLGVTRGDVVTCWCPIFQMLWLRSGPLRPLASLTP
jgi:acyl-CoA synthetase (AMP-forming)/AMP-acid ligase II